MKVLTAHISCANLATVDDVKGRAGNAVRKVVETLGDEISELDIKGRKNFCSPQVPQHHGCRQDHGSRVSFVCTHDVLGNVTASRLEKSIFLEKGVSILAHEKLCRRTYAADVATRDDTGATDKSSTDV